jgi:hypothetical protein
MGRAASVCLILMVLAGCSAQPVPFKTGEEVQPPYGCIEYRQRGGKC